jgi:ABC-type uncharacterized transport system YnjBCD ATPase subunit
MWRQEGRVLELQVAEVDLAIQLGLGGSYTFSHDDPQLLDDLADALEQHAWVIPPDGGLLSGLSVGANLALALSDGVHSALAQDEALQDALQAAGMSAEKLAQLHRLRPSDLNALELWTVAWAIALLRKPTLLVLDQPMTHLNHAQQGAVLAMVALFQRKHPTCAVLWLLLAPSLSPSLAPSPCLEEAACLS